jgi:predicted RNA-binding Zn-ribbon protein involved in translation (DUF1610 family)
MVGALILIFVSILFGMIIMLIGILIQHGEKSSSGSGISEKEVSILCPKCGVSHFYHYSEKDAFGRILCKSCGHLFHPNKDSESQADPSSSDVTRYQPKGPPRSIGPDDCEISQMAVGLANTHIEFETVRRAVRDMAGSLGQDRLSDMIRMGLTYLSANRVAAALACFYEAEQIQYGHPRLEKIRAEFGLPKTSFKEIAEKVI